MRYAQAMALCLFAILTLGSVDMQAAEKREAVIVQCAAPHDHNALVSSLRQLGGNITYEYENIEAVALSIPADRLPEVLTLAGVKAVFKDVIVPQPRPVSGVPGVPSKGFSHADLTADGAQALDTAALPGLIQALPANYNFNNSLTGAATLHADGKLGEGVVVALIDSGTTNWVGVPALSDTVIGGENLVPAATDPVLSATSRANDPHGTWTASMIAAHANFLFGNTSTLVQSLQIHAPDSVFPCPGPPFIAPCSATVSIVPMIGTCPGCKIYAVKVFPSFGGGSPESRIIAAMDRALTLRRNFREGFPSTPIAGDGSEDNPFVYNSLNIQIVNMSLGGGTLFAGRDLEDQLTVQMLVEGITIVTSAGNDGFAAMTGGSPGTGFGSLTMAAANTSVHERVLRDVQFGLGAGALYRPSEAHQIAYFSARGPTADGRFDPDVTANGFASFAQGSCLGFSPGASRTACLAGTIGGPINFVSGTSFSSPTAAGAAALLRKEVPNAAAVQIRNALVETANPNLLADGTRRIDQGKGFLYIPEALGRLKSGKVSRTLEFSKPSKSVSENIKRLGFRVIDFGERECDEDERDKKDKKEKEDNEPRIFSRRVENLRPGEVAQLFIRSCAQTELLRVSLSNITPELPPGQQNFFFGDDIFLNVVDAPTSFGVFRVEEFVNADKTFLVDNPQSGIVRVALQGDWTNAGRISADVVIEETREELPRRTARGKIAQGELEAVEVEVPGGTSQAVFELFWKQDWGAYPTNDVDMILLDPTGALILGGVTSNSPERVVIDKPAPGVWGVFIDGFTIHGQPDKFTLRVTADGEALPAVEN